MFGDGGVDGCPGGAVELVVGVPGGVDAGGEGAFVLVAVGDVEGGVGGAGAVGGLVGVVAEVPGEALGGDLEPDPVAEQGEGALEGWAWV